MSVTGCDRFAIVALFAGVAKCGAATEAVTVPAGDVGLELEQATAANGSANARTTQQTRQRIQHIRAMPRAAASRIRPASRRGDRCDAACRRGEKLSKKARTEYLNIKWQSI